MAIRTDPHQNKHHLRHHVIPERNEGLDIGLTGQRFNSGRFKTIIVDSLEAITATITTIMSVTITTLTAATATITSALNLSFLGNGYLKTSGGTGAVGVQTVPIPVPDGGTGATTLSSGAYLKGAGTSAITTQAAPIPVTDGGTGATTFVSGAYLKGAGAGAITTQAVPIPVADGGTGAGALALNSLIFAGAGGVYSASADILWINSASRLQILQAAPALPTGSSDGAATTPRALQLVDGTSAAPLTGQTFLTPSAYIERWDATAAGTTNSILTTKIDTIFQGAFTAQAPAFGGSLITRAFADASPGAGINQVASLNGYAYMTSGATKTVIWGVVGVAQLNSGAPIATAGANAAELDLVNNAANPAAAETPGGTNQSAAYGLYLNSVGSFQGTTAISIHASTGGGGANAWQNGLYISGIVTGNPYILIDSGVASGGRIALLSAGNTTIQLNNESGTFRVFSGATVLFSVPQSGPYIMGTRLALGAGAAATLGTVGSPGPTTAAQANWMKFTDVGGTGYWIPVWV